MSEQLEKARRLENDAEYWTWWANRKMFKFSKIFENREYNPYCDTSHPSDIEHSVFTFSTYIAFLMLIVAIFAMVVGGAWGVLQWGMLVVGTATLPACFVYATRAAIMKSVKLYARILQRKASRLRKEHFKTNANIQDFFRGTREVAKKLDYTPANKEDTIQKYELIIKAIEKLVAKMEFDKEYDLLKSRDEKDAVVDEILSEIKLDLRQEFTDKEMEKFRSLVFQCINGVKSR